MLYININRHSFSSIKLYIYIYILYINLQRVYNRRKYMYCNIIIYILFVDNYFIDKNFIFRRNFF